MQRFISMLAAIVSILGLALTSSICSANPNHRDVNAAMDVHELADSTQALTRAQSQYADSVKMVSGVVERGQRVAAKALAEASISLRQLRRAALDLQMNGEPAGFDFELRCEPLQAQFDQVLGAFKATNVGATQAAKVSQFLNQTRQVQARTATLQKIRQLLQQQKLDEAYEAFSKAFDEFASMTMFLPQAEEERLRLPFVSLESQIVTPRNQAYRKRVREALTQAGDSLIPNLDALVKEVTAAAASLQSSGTVQAGGQPLTGPQALSYYGNAWKLQHLNALRCRAIDWARIVKVPDAPYLEKPTTGNRVDQQQYQKLVGQVTQALAGLVQADAQRATAESVPGLYAEYLTTIAPLTAGVADDSLTLALEPALANLAAKSEDVKGQVTGYQQATHELLRWKQRVAASIAKAYTANFPSSTERMQQATSSGPQYRGLLAENQPLPAQANLMGSCPEILTGAVPRLLDQPIRIQHVTGLAGGKFAVARYGDRHYAMVAQPQLEAAVTQLRSDLLVADDQTAPLSLEAAVALWTAENGDYEQAGGIIKGVYLEGLIPRFATLRETALPVVPLGPLPDEPDDELLINHVLLRLDILPTWVQHRYFFVDLAAAAQSAGTL